MSRICIIILIACVACQNSDYLSLEKKELASGVRYDSLFEGLYLGMEKTEFRKRCFQLNQDSIFTDGVAAKIRYKVKGLGAPATILFFPDFRNERIYQLPATVQYDAWAPWNANLSSDSLVEDMKRLTLNWYNGNPFYEIKNESRPSAWLKVDGNRRITIRKDDESRIKIMFRDLTIKEEE